MLKAEIIEDGEHYFSIIYEGEKENFPRPIQWFFSP